MDVDIKNSIAITNDLEKKYGAWDVEQDDDGMWNVPNSDNAQLDADIHLTSDPICSSAGCDQYKHPDSK